METSRFNETKKVGILGIVGNVFLLLIKGSVGFATKSQSMIADSFNSAGDIFASLMTFIGNKISSEPQDEDHNFGHGKAEYIFSMFIGISMFVIACKLLYNSIHTLIFGSELIFSWLLVIVSIITIMTKLFLFLYTHNIAKKMDNILLNANMADHRNDCFVTTFTLISAILSIKGIYLFDSIVGIGISIWIGYTGIKFFIESYNVLMDISVDENTMDLILDIANSYSDIKKIEQIRSTPVGYKYIIFITICVDGNMTTFDSHKLADSLELDVNNLDKVYNTIVHVDPV
ncbi:MAG: cation transporter [Clostridia bacterium]|nr:cation transporter [Clostridia bacterium]